MPCFVCGNLLDWKKAKNITKLSPAFVLSWAILKACTSIIDSSVQKKQKQTATTKTKHPEQCKFAGQNTSCYMHVTPATVSNI